MAFFDPYDHGDSRQPADFGFFHEHSYDLLEANASMPDPCSDLNDSQLFRDSFSGLHSGSEPLQYPGESEQSAPALESAIVCSDTHIPSASSPNTSDSPLPSSQSQPLKKLDEPDSSCRPRLTPEQTAVLEEYYSHTPRPTTQQKRQHAAKLGLTLEKVNNWFQNRRAKSKQQNRIRREFEIIPIREHAMEMGHDFALRGMPGAIPHGFHHPSLSDHVMHLHMLPSHSMGPHGVQPAIFDEQFPRYPEPFALAMPDHAHQSNDFAAGSFDAPKDLHPLDLAAQHLDCQNDLFHTHSNQSLQSMDASASSRSSLYPLASVTSGSDTSDSQAAASELNGRTPTLPPHIVTKVDPDQSTLTSPGDSPRTAPAMLSSKVSPVDAADLERRGSLASDLANNFDTIHLHRVVSQPVSNPTSDDEVFKTPEVPPMGLAARRNRRPAALASMRTVSVPAAQSSPREVAMSRSLRHHKSTGTNLNIGPMRVQKPVSLSGQKSPRSFSTFREVGVSLDKLVPNHSLDAQGPDSMEELCQDGPAHLRDPISPTDSLLAGGPPPLSATFNSVDGTRSHAASPPFTPFGVAAPISQTLWLSPPGPAPWGEDAVPQSAPAHITSFPNYSPTIPPQGGSPGAFYTPQPCYPASYFPEFPPMQPAAPPPPPAQQLPSSLPTSAIGPPPGGIGSGFQSSADATPQSLLQQNESGSAAGQFTFFAAPPPASKELEVVMTHFPTPKGEAAPIKLKLPQHFSFQNSGPRDFA